MLGVLISILMFGLFWFWIALIKNLRKFKRGEGKMPIFEFVLFCLLTYLIITPLLFVVCTIIDDTCLDHVILNHEVNIAIAMLICLLIVTLFVLSEIKSYRKRLHIMRDTKQEKHINRCVDSSKSISQPNNNILRECNKKSLLPQNHTILQTQYKKDFSPTTFIKTFTLIDFAKLYGPKMKVGTCTNGITHKDYKVCMFTNKNGVQTYVRFSSELGELTPSQIIERKKELMIGQLPSGKYVMYDYNWQDWVDVDLDI